MIRKATVDDFPFIIDLAVKRYPKFDVESSLLWARKAIDLPGIMIARGEKSFAIGSIAAPFYDPTTFRGYMVFLCAQEDCGYEPVPLARFLIKWALIERGASSFHFGEATGVNLAPLAKRLGADIDSPSYVVKSHGQNL